MVKHSTIRVQSARIWRNIDDTMPVYLNHDDALILWRDALGARVRVEGPDLSARQMAILLTVYTLSPPHTVRGLSDALNISKPAVSRALDRLGQLGYLRRRPDDYDRRSIHVELTLKGGGFLSEFANTIAQAGRDLESPTPFEAGTPKAGHHS